MYLLQNLIFIAFRPQKFENRERERERERRQTDRQTDRQTETEIDRQIDLDSQSKDEGK